MKEEWKIKFLSIKTVVFKFFYFFNFFLGGIQLFKIMIIFYNAKESILKYISCSNCEQDVKYIVSSHRHDNDESVYPFVFDHCFLFSSFLPFFSPFPPFSFFLCIHVVFYSIGTKFPHELLCLCKLIHSQCHSFFRCFRSRRGKSNHIAARGNFSKWAELFSYSAHSRLWIRDKTS